MNHSRAWFPAYRAPGPAPWRNNRPPGTLAGYRADRPRLTVAGRSAERWLFAGGNMFDRTSMILLPIADDLSLLLVGSYNMDGDATGPARLDRLQRSIELFFDRPTDPRSPAQQLMP